MATDPIEHAREKVLDALRNYKGKGTIDEEDALFREYALIVEQVAKGKGPNSRAIADLFMRDLLPAARAAEARIAGQIHKGAPHYNCGLCLILSHDFEGALAHFEAAAEEDLRTRGAQKSGLMTGNHKLSKQVLIDPLLTAFIPKLSADYQAITGRSLTDGELSSLLTWTTALDFRDLIPLLVALHSMNASHSDPETEASGVRRVGALRDMHVTIESALGRLNIGTGTLHPRMEHCLSGNPQAAAGFAKIHGLFTAQFPNEPDRHTTQALNFIVSRACAEFDLSRDRHERAGIAGYASVKIRNGILHKNKATDLHNNSQLALRMAGWALATLRTVKHVSEGTF